MSAWLEVEPGTSVNLDRVCTITRLDDYNTTIYFKTGEAVDSVTVAMPYTSLMALVRSRTQSSSDASREQTDILTRIASQQFTPVP